MVTERSLLRHELHVTVHFASLISFFLYTLLTLVTYAHPRLVSPHINPIIFLVVAGAGWVVLTFIGWRGPSMPLQKTVAIAIVVVGSAVSLYFAKSLFAASLPVLDRIVFVCSTPIFIGAVIGAFIRR